MRFLAIVLAVLALPAAPSAAAAGPFTLQVTTSGTGSGSVASAPPGIACGATCSSSYSAGTRVTLTATAAAGSTFVGWLGSCRGTDPCTVTMNAAHSVIAQFTPSGSGPLLIVGKNGPATGVVTSSVAGIDCGATCWANYPAGTSVTLTAVGTFNGVMFGTFAGWSGGGCSGTSTCTVKLDATTSVVATFTGFDLYWQTLTVNKAGSGLGMVSSATEDCAPSAATCTFRFFNGAPVVLSAYPEAGSTFAGWGAPCSGTGICEFAMQGTRTMSASFDRTFELSTATLAFGGQLRNTASAARTITFTNRGSAALTVTSVAAAGPFVQTNNCAALAPAASCTVSVRFAPTVEGPASGSITIQSSAGPGVALLTGTGAGSFVARYYTSILRRAADAGGQAFWDAEAVRVTGLGANVNEVWYSMAQTFYFSPEYAAFNRDNSGFVTDLYVTFFNRQPDTGGLAFWVGNLNAGMPREVALAEFMFSVEFRNFSQAIFGNPTVRAEQDTVMDFYRGLLSRLPDDGGFDFWVGRFRTAQCQGQAAVVAQVESISSAFTLSPEYSGRNRTTAQYVGDLYNAFLRRGGDLGGVQFWINEINTGARTREQVRVDFRNSPEFQSRVQAIVQQGCL